MISESTMKDGNLSIYNYQIHKTIFFYLKYDTL